MNADKDLARKIEFREGSHFFSGLECNVCGHRPTALNLWKEQITPPNK